MANYRVKYFVFKLGLLVSFEPQTVNTTKISVIYRFVCSRLEQFASTTGRILNA